MEKPWSAHEKFCSPDCKQLCKVGAGRQFFFKQRLTNAGAENGVGLEVKLGKTFCVALASQGATENGVRGL
jgi:hypothetical protein